jgi:hypothetical protein
MHTVRFAISNQNNSSTAIDNVFVDTSRLNITSVSPITNGQSQHDAQVLTIKTIRNNKQFSLEPENQINE